MIPTWTSGRLSRSSSLLLHGSQWLLNNAIAILQVPLLLFCRCCWWICLDGSTSASHSGWNPNACRLIPLLTFNISCRIILFMFPRLPVLLDNALALLPIMSGGRWCLLTPFLQLQAYHEGAMIQGIGWCVFGTPREFVSSAIWRCLHGDLGDASRLL